MCGICKALYRCIHRFLTVNPNYDHHYFASTEPAMVEWGRRMDIKRIRIDWLLGAAGSSGYHVALLGAIARYSRKIANELPDN